MRILFLGALMAFLTTFGHSASTDPVLGDTLCFRVDKSSFPKITFDSLATKGKLNDRDLFHNTYITKVTTDTDSYYCLKITPQTQNELDQLMGFVGKGAEILWIYNEGGGMMSPKVDYSDSVPITKYQINSISQ